VADVHFNLLIAVFFGIEPKVREGWLEQPSAYTVKVGHVIPLPLTSVEDLVEVAPLGDVGLHVDDVVLTLCECVVVGCCSKIGDENTCTESMRLFC
jgi:hypothetical protein